MTLDDVDEVVALRNHRRRFIELREAMEANPLCDLHVHRDGGGIINVWSVISAMPVRQAIVDECDREIERNSRRLEELGVEIR